jgi:cyanophycinase
MLGGFPGHLAETLLDTLAWDAIQSALQNGAVVGGSSAGAMVMCEYFFDPYRGQLVPGLGLLPNTIVLPHHNRFGKNWAARLGQMLPGAILIGIDEQTGMIADSQDGCWRVYGRGSVTIYQNGGPRLIPDGQEFFLNTNS